MERYEKVADLLMLSYEGAWTSPCPGASRTQIADHFVDHALAPWIGYWGASGDELATVAEESGRACTGYSRVGMIPRHSNRYLPLSLRSSTSMSRLRYLPASGRLPSSASGTRV